MIGREVIAKKRKALIVYGEMHYLRREAQRPPMAGQPAQPQPGTIVSLHFSLGTFPCRQPSGTSVVPSASHRR
jgi:hypothetical protein